MNRIHVLKELLTKGDLSTQEELVSKLAKHHFSVTQSTVSRDLRKLGAIRTIDSRGRAVYKLNPLTIESPQLSGSLGDLILSIEHNDSTIVIQTTPGSASLIARHLDQVKPGGLLGTIAGDDTIFVAPKSSRAIPGTIQAIRDSLN